MDNIISNFFTGQHFASILGHEHHVFDAHAEIPLEIDPRFEREEHPRLQHRFIALADRRRFVDVEPDAVTERVAETLSEPALFDDPPRDAVERAAGHARLQRRDRPGRFGRRKLYRSTR